MIVFATLTLPQAILVERARDIDRARVAGGRVDRLISLVVELLNFFLERSTRGFRDLKVGTDNSQFLFKID